VRGITLESLKIETHGEIDLRGFLGIDPAVPAGYENLSYIVRIKDSGTKEEFAEVHEAVMATSPKFYKASRAVAGQSAGRRGHTRAETTYRYAHLATGTMRSAPERLSAPEALPAGK
jgi:hypothetical protein